MEVIVWSGYKDRTLLIIRMSVVRLKALVKKTVSAEDL